MEFCDENQCADCCRDAKVPLLNADVDRIIMHGYYDVYFVDDYKGIKMLRTRDDGSCVFHNKGTGSCEVYVSRPERCKLNPYCINDTDPRPHIDRGCRHSASCKEDPSMKRSMAEYIASLEREIGGRKRAGF